MKNIGMILIGIGIIMIAFTSFNFVTEEKVLDLGKLEINKQENHPVRWSPILGGVLLVGGIVLLVVAKKQK